MIRFEKGLGDHYRMALERKVGMTQATQDSLVEGDWVRLIMDANGTERFDLLPADGSVGINALPCVANPLQPEHGGPFVPLPFAVDKSDIVFTDRYDTTAAGKLLYTAGFPLVCKRFVLKGGVTPIYGVVPVSYEASTGAADDANLAAGVSAADLSTLFSVAAAAKEMPFVVGRVVGINAAGELAFLWGGGA